MLSTDQEAQNVLGQSQNSGEGPYIALGKGRA